jgi:two-component system sensor histidine kinase ArlS
MSLRLRLTVLTSLILVAVCVFLTLISIYNADQSFYQPYSAIASRQYSQVSDSNPNPNPNLYQPGYIFYTPRLPESSYTYAVPGVAATLGEEAQLAYRASKQSFTYSSVFYMIAIVFAGGVAVWFIAGRALKSVTILSQTIEKVDGHNMSVQIPVPESNDEVSRLTVSFNSMLTKLNGAFEEQKRFAQNAAHELKTPLAAILTNIEVMELEEEPDVSAYKEVVQVAKENTERMTMLVKDLLMFNSATVQAQYSVFEFSEILSQILADYAGDIQMKHIKIRVKNDVMMRGNKTMLERGFSNIIQNAIRYNRDYGKITILCSENEIWISDTGIGVPSDQLNNIFEPFYCVDISRSRRLGGSGLGLSITKQIFDKHNMKIRAQSIENQGTTFIISLVS